MTDIYSDNTVPEHQRVQALKVLGNLGHPSSLALIREICAHSTANIAQKNTNEPTLVRQILALDSLRNIDAVEAQIERAQILLDCLSTKADRSLHIAAIVAFYTSTPSHDQSEVFWNLVDNHGMTEQAILTFEWILECAINEHNRQNIGE
jgi:hypothetical protein